MAVSAVKKEPIGAPEAADKAASQPKPPRPKKKLLIPLAVLLVIVAAGAGAYWHSTRAPGSTPQKARSQPAKPPLFVPLETFTVNLQIEDNPQFLQVGLTLKVVDSAVSDALKLYMPEVRDRILRLLSSRKASELLTLDGKQKLSADIVAAANTVLAPAGLTSAPSGPAPAEAAAADGADAADAPADNEKPAADAAPATGAITTPGPGPGNPVLSVLFTSFIVQ